MRNMGHVTWALSGIFSAASLIVPTCPMVFSLDEYKGRWIHGVWNSHFPTTFEDILSEGCHVTEIQHHSYRKMIYPPVN